MYYDVMRWKMDHIHIHVPSASPCDASITIHIVSVIYILQRTWYLNLVISKGTIMCNGYRDSANLLNMLQV